MKVTAEEIVAKYEQQANSLKQTIRFNREYGNKQLAEQLDMMRMTLGMVVNELKEVTA